MLSAGFNNSYEEASDILRNISIPVQFVALTIIGVKELLVKKNKAAAYLDFVLLLIALTFFLYLMKLAVI